MTTSGAKSNPICLGNDNNRQDLMLNWQCWWQNLTHFGLDGLDTFESGVDCTMYRCTYCESHLIKKSIWYWLVTYVSDSTLPNKWRFPWTRWTPMTPYGPLAPNPKETFGIPTTVTLVMVIDRLHVVSRGSLRVAQIEPHEPQTFEMSHRWATLKITLFATINPRK